MKAIKRDFYFSPNVIQIVAKNVRKYRKFACLTQEELANAIGVSHSYFRHFESTLGKEGMSLYTLYKISIVLDISMDKFFL